MQPNVGWDGFWVEPATVGIAITVAHQPLNLCHTDSQPYLLNSRWYRYQRWERRHEYNLGQQELSDAMRWKSIAFVPRVLAFTVPDF